MKGWSSRRSVVDLFLEHVRWLRRAGGGGLGWSDAVLLRMLSVLAWSTPGFEFCVV
jgi:hypothetical protein